jgi:NAD(P)-dependent dehydrogenase (short-subunit alcohol dehydrogenase family)
MRLQGKVILITGGASGIGRATALRAAAEGAAVAIADRNEAGGSETVALIHRADGRASFYGCDVTDEDSVRQAVAEVIRDYGALHILINGAGILQGAYRPVEALDRETFARVLDVNVLGTFLFCKHAAPVIEASGGGVVLCIGSMAGVRGPSSSLAYGASKAAIQGLCYTLEPQLAPRGIRVNVVCPGSLDTPMKRENLRDGALARGEDPDAALAAVRLGDPDGVARVLAFLASEDGDYVRGTILTC